MAIKTLSLLVVLALSGCANLGDGKFNPEFSQNFGDGLLLGVEYKPYLRDAALVLSAYKPGTAQMVIDKLLAVRTQVENSTASYDLPNGVQEVQERLLKECGVWCSLTTSKPYVDRFADQLDALKSVNTDDISVSLLQVIDSILVEIKNAQ